MLADAEKYAAADKEKRETIDLKNQAETLCFEAEKELSVLKDTIATDKQENILKLITTIRQANQNDETDRLKISLDELKTAMKEMLDSKVDSGPNLDPTSDLNDL
jgi:molecular chaperone DnaK